MKLDATDHFILNKIQENALLTTKEIAADLGISYTPVYERVRKLEREGVIKKYVALINRDKVGKKLMAFCNVSLKEHSRSNGEKFVKAVLDFTEVMECHNISGSYDFMLKIVVNDMPEYQQFLMNKLGALDCIGNTHSIFVMSEIKNETSFQITNQPD
jgi:Lrp/AsnC family transcriptional regulator, leucine-responsive regulatory protein